MIDEAAIAKMKDGVVFLNFARDLLVKMRKRWQLLWRAGKVHRYVSDFPNRGKREYEERDHALPHLACFHGGVGGQLRCNGSERADELSGSWKYCKFRELPAALTWDRSAEPDVSPSSTRISRI